LLNSTEARRKLIHMAVGGLAFLLRWMSWRQAALMAIAAFFFNRHALPRLGGRGLWREPDHGRGYALGILLYPLAVLALILVFHDELWKAAALWGILALGDGMAALVGLAAGGPRLPWNVRKTWAGLLAFVVFGTLAASVLAGWTLRLPLTSWLSPRILAVTVPVVLLCAFVESMTTTLDDNLTVPLVGAAAMGLVSQADAGLLLDDPRLGGRLFVGLVLNSLIAGAAYAAGVLDRGGAASAVLVGTAVVAGLGPAALVPMIAFFVLGTAATRLGHVRKSARGIAQEHGGARGWRNAWANGAVPAALALLAASTPAELAAL
jgi:dolichol kinase